MAELLGNATWYDLCIGGAHDTGSGGACQDCHDNAFDLAWPNLTTTQCYDHCGTNWALACSDTMEVMSWCNYAYHQGRVADCCPCASQEGCDQIPRCPEGQYTGTDVRKPLLDLTSGFFAWLTGDLSLGRIPVRLYR